MIARILHNAGLRLQDQLLNTLAFVDETRGILSEGAGVHTRASGTASLMSHNTLPRPLPSQPNVVPSFLSVCHQSISKDAQAGHVDVMGPMAESKVALTSGGGPWIEARLDASGAYQKIPVAACCFPRRPQQAGHCGLAKVFAAVAVSIRRGRLAAVPAMTCWCVSSLGSESLIFVS